jgi:hypothetical protein
MPVVRNQSGVAAFALLALLTTAAHSADEERTIPLADGKLTLEAPEKWKRQEPKLSIIEHEFAVEGKKGQEAGRMTIMAAGGGIQQNIDRWVGQFAAADGKKSKEKPKIEKKKVAGLEVHVVDLSGTYLDSAGGGPFARGKTIERKNYRMLAAIIPGGPSIGNYFIKLYGPAELVKENEKAFSAMIDSLSKK